MDDKKFEEPIFKHFFKTKTFGGFCSIIPFNEGRKFNIQVGQVEADNKLKQFTPTYVEFVLLGAYLRSVVRGTVADAFENATLVVYGGGTVDGEDVARILKIAPDSGEYTPKVDYFWKCGHFKARKTSTGAYVPDMKSPIQQNGIKISRQTMDEISYIIDNHIMKVELGKV